MRTAKPFVPPFVFRRLYEKSGIFSPTDCMILPNGLDSMSKWFICHKFNNDETPETIFLVLTHYSFCL